MKTFLYRPHNLLAPFIEAYAITYPNEPAQNSHFYPTNLPVLCFDLNQKHFKESNGGDEFNFPLGIVGVLDRYFYLDRIPDKSVQVIFKPFGAFQFFRTPMQYFVNNGTDLEAVIPNLKEYVHKLQDTGDDEVKCLKELECFLLDQLRRRPDTYRYFDQVQYVCRYLKNNQEPLNIDQICRKINMSHTRLRVHFKEKIGVSPKRFSQIEKFQQIHTYCLQQPQIEWMDIVGQFSFFDQTHFIKGFKQFFGCTPSAFDKHRTSSIPQNIFDLLHQ